MSGVSSCAVGGEDEDAARLRGETETLRDKEKEAQEKKQERK